MSDIQMLEVSPGATRATLKFDALTFQAFRGQATPRGNVLRIYARESAGAPTFALWHSLEAALLKVVRPNSALRHAIAHQPAAAARVDRRFFVIHTVRARVEPLEVRDPLPRAEAALVATRDAARQGDVVIEVAGDATETLIDQVWAELSAGIAQAPAAARTESAAAARLTPGEAARRRREAFLDRGWPTSSEVGMRLGSAAGAAAQRAAELRGTGQLLGAWSSRSRTYVHPDCQFDAVNQVQPVMRALLRILPTEGDDGGWRRTFWLYGPRDALDGQAPADVLGVDSERVLTLARAEFGDAPAAAAPAPSAGAA